MGKFFIEGERERVTFEDGEWVEVKQELTQEDSDYILNCMAKDGTAKANLGQMPLLELSILAWSFKVDKGQPIPINKDTISKLHVKYRSIIFKKIDELNTAAKEFKKLEQLNG